MSDPKPRTTVDFDHKPAPHHDAHKPEPASLDELTIDKPVSEMTPGEKEEVRRKALETARAKVAAGNKNLYVFDCEDLDIEEYKGKITFSRPSIDSERRVGILVAKYLGGVVGVDVKTENIAIYLATFDVCVDWKTAPEWFKPREMPSSDYPVLDAIYRGYSEWLGTFRRDVRKPAQGRSETSAS